jgi:adenosylhomocysteine nucleosidase
MKQTLLGALFICALCATMVNGLSWFDAWREKSGRNMKDAIMKSQNKPSPGTVWQWSTGYRQTALPGLFGIIAAFNAEAEETIKQMSTESRVIEQEFAGRTFYLGLLGGKKVVLTICGVGTNNAVMTQQLFFDKYRVDKAIFTGIAGGVGPEVKVGDVIIATQFANNQHQKFVRSYEGTSFFAETWDNFPNKYYRGPDGKIPSSLRPSCEDCNLPASQYQNGNWTYIEEDDFWLCDNPHVLPGMAIPMYIETLTGGDSALKGTMPQEFWFNVSDELIAAARRAAADVNNRHGVDALHCPEALYTYNNGTCPSITVGGRGLAGSTFLDNAEHRIQLHEQFGATFIDMETPAIMHTCLANKKDCIAIRSMSDLAGGEAEGNALYEFFQVAAANSVITLRALLKQL